MLNKITNHYLSSKFVLNFIIINMVVLLITSFFIIPTTDTYYYWTWSKNLQLSYYDGPPMIAYLIWVTTHLFGNNLFAINIISVFCVFCSGLVINKISFYLGGNNKMIAFLIWLVYPFATTRFITISMTLDALEVFFSLLIILFTCRLITNLSNKNIYYLAIVIGFGLLAKYNLVVLILAIMIFFLLNPQLRKVYLNYHLYIAMGLSLIIFSPVLIWNYNNNWASFYYQLYSHNWNGGEFAINTASNYGIKGVWFYLKACVFGVLHILLIVSLYLSLIKKVYLDKNIYCKLIIFVFIFILLFWLYKSFFAHIGLNYMLTSSAILILILSQQLAKVNLVKHLKFILILFSIISVIMQIDRLFVHSKDVENYNKYIKTGKLGRPLMEYLQKFDKK
jgi:4-amino-4-deoxy-L-arabinose transferase-like glycosyltransferase